LRVDEASFTPEAEQQADECDTWWRKHRDARDLFARELAGIKTLLRESANVRSRTSGGGSPSKRVVR
jgi:hypothetical protein